MKDEAGTAAAGAAGTSRTGVSGVAAGGSQFSVSGSDGTWDAAAAAPPPPVVRGRFGGEEVAGYEVALRKVCSL